MQQECNYRDFTQDGILRVAVIHTRGEFVFDGVERGERGDVIMALHAVVI